MSPFGSTMSASASRGRSGYFAYMVSTWSVAFALGAGSVHVTGAEIVNWEDIAVAPCPGGSCLYIGDIGDNHASRSSIAIYRVPEPAPNAKATDQAEVMHATYPVSYTHLR